MGVKFTNKAATLLNAGLDTTATTVTVNSTIGFPSVAGNDYFWATIEQEDASNVYEVVKVTAVSGNDYTIVRSASPQSFTANDIFAVRVTAEGIQDPSLLQTGVTTDSLSVTGDTLIDGEIDIQHEHKLRFKQSDESTDQLVIDTSGTNSRIQETGGGHLYITGDRVILSETTNSTDSRILIGDNNGVKLYGDDKLRMVIGNGVHNSNALADEIHFYTGAGAAGDFRARIKPTGFSVTGDIDASGVFKLGNGSNSDASIQLGDPSGNGGNIPLKIYHDGTDTYIKENASGQFALIGDDIHIRTGDADGNNYRLAIKDGVDEGTSLFHGTSNGTTNKKFETLATGAKVTGTLDTDGLTVGQQDTLKFGDVGSQNLSIFTDSNGEARIEESNNGTFDTNGSLTIKGGNVYIKNNANEALFTGAGSAMLGYGGNVKLQTWTSGVRVFSDSDTQGALSFAERGDANGNAPRSIHLKPLTDTWNGNYTLSLPTTGTATLATTDDLATYSLATDTVNLTGDQSVAGNKTFSNNVAVTGTTTLSSDLVVNNDSKINLLDATNKTDLQMWLSTDADGTANAILRHSARNHLGGSFYIRGENLYLRDSDDNDRIGYGSANTFISGSGGGNVWVKDNITSFTGGTGYAVNDLVRFAIGANGAKKYFWMRVTAVDNSGIIQTWAWWAQTEGGTPADYISDTTAQTLTSDGKFNFNHDLQTHSGAAAQVVLPVNWKFNSVLEANGGIRLSVPVQNRSTARTDLHVGANIHGTLAFTDNPLLLKHDMTSSITQAGSGFKNGYFYGVEPTSRSGSSYNSRFNLRFSGGALVEVVSYTQGGGHVVGETLTFDTTTSGWGYDADNSWASVEVTRTGGAVAIVTLQQADIAATNITGVDALTATGEIEGGSLDINGNADISGDITGVGTVTAGRIILEDSSNAEITLKNTDVNGVVTSSTIKDDGHLKLTSADNIILKGTANAAPDDTNYTSSIFKVQPNGTNTILSVYSSSASNSGIAVTGTAVATAIESAPTTLVTSNGTVPTVAVNKKYIDTYDGAENEYVLPSGTSGQMITFVNGSTSNIKLNRDTNSITLERLTPGFDPANITTTTIPVGKSGVVEVVYTGDDTAVVFGSGLTA